MPGVQAALCREMSVNRSGIYKWVKRQSMSRKGNCLDKSPMENFFGHMKGEIGKKMAACETDGEPLDYDFGDPDTSLPYINSFKL